MSTINSGNTRKEYSNLVALMSSEFNKYLMEHEDESRKIPANALVIFQIAGETNFNMWSKKISLENREKDQPLVYVTVKKWRQRTSVEELDIVI